MQYSVLATSLIVIAMLLIAWSVISMAKSQLKVFPEPGKNATLVTSGPYGLIRHPMYTALILACIGMLIANFTWLRLLLVIALCVVLIVKLLYEEKLLSEKFNAYTEYKRKTYRLLPFVF